MSQVSPPKRRVAAAAISALLLLGGCAAGPNPLAHHAEPGRAEAGFGLGFWHGVIIAPAFFWSLFDHNVSMYEVHNDGWPYNLGFLIGALCFHGGGATAARRRRSED